MLATDGAGEGRGSCAAGVTCLPAIAEAEKGTVGLGPALAPRLCPLGLLAAPTGYAHATCTNSRGVLRELERLVWPERVGGGRDAC